MVQPWARKRDPHPAGKTAELVYDFDVRARVSGDVFLAIERPDLYEVTLNGAAVSTLADAGWWVDHSLRRVAVDPVLLRLGRNELILRTVYNENHPGFEMVYLLGHFGQPWMGRRFQLCRCRSR